LVSSDQVPFAKLGVPVFAQLGFGLAKKRMSFHDFDGVSAVHIAVYWFSA